MSGSLTVPNRTGTTGIPGGRHPLPPTEAGPAPTSITVTLNDDGTITYTNATNSTPPFGTADAQHVWAFKSTMLSGAMTIASAIANDLNNTVTTGGFSRPLWAQNIANAMQPIQTAQAAVVKVCNDANPSPPPTPKPTSI